MRYLILFLLIVSSSFSKGNVTFILGNDTISIEKPIGVNETLINLVVSELVTELLEQDRDRLTVAVDAATHTIPYLNLIGTTEQAITAVIGGIKQPGLEIVIVDSLELFDKGILAIYNSEETKIYIFRSGLEKYSLYIGLLTVYHELTHYFQDQFGYLDDEFFTIPVAELSADLVSYEVVTNQFNTQDVDSQYWMYSIESLSAFYNRNADSALYDYTIELLTILRAYYVELAEEV